MFDSIFYAIEFEHYDTTKTYQLWINEQACLWCSFATRQLISK
jgi:hypothetical protein